MKRRAKIPGCLLLLVGGPLVLGLGIVAFCHALNPLVLGGRADANGSILSGGRRRDYLLHLPAGRDPSELAPLVISLHPAAVYPAVVQRASRWDELADQAGFLVVYPWGRRMAPLPILPSLPVWPVESEEAVAEEVAFIGELIDELVRAHRVDPRRIYVNGFSNGGAMAFVLSCRMADRIAAVGTVAAANVLPWSECGDALPMPLIAFHGIEDPLVPYAGGDSLGFSFPSAADWAASWARRNQCRSGAVSTPLVDATRLDYSSCADGADVRLYGIRGGGHTWPGGRPLPRLLLGRTGSGLDATREMWEFFQQHARERPTRN